jgi:hypothetical protein
MPRRVWWGVLNSFAGYSDIVNSFAPSQTVSSLMLMLMLILPVLELGIVAYQQLINSMVEATMAQLPQRDSRSIFLLGSRQIYHPSSSTVVYRAAQVLCSNITGIQSHEKSEEWTNGRIPVVNDPLDSTA